MKWHCRKRNCIMMVMLSAVLFFSGCSVGNTFQQVSKTYVAMGTVVNVTLYVEDKQQGIETQRLLEERLIELENRYLSYRIENSEIWNVNHSNGEPIPLSDFLYEYLQEIWKLSEMSDGALDVTVGEITRLWNIDTYAEHPEGFTIPSEEILKQALQKVGYHKIAMDKSLELPAEMSIDLGAVGKGIACDVMKDILEKQEIPAAVISVGGSNLLWGEKKGGRDWMVGVAHPRKEGDYLGYLRVKEDCFVATSGDYERYVMVDGERYHHIMNPKTGMPARSGLCGVTIVSDSGLLSDALSTACFVLGKEKGMLLAKKCGAEALFVEENGSITMTEGMKELWLLKQ